MKALIRSVQTKLHHSRLDHFAFSYCVCVFCVILLFCVICVLWRWELVCHRWIQFRCRTLSLSSVSRFWAGSVGLVESVMQCHYYISSFLPGSLRSQSWKNTQTHMCAVFFSLTVPIFVSGGIFLLELCQSHNCKVLVPIQRRGGEGWGSQLPQVFQSPLLCYIPPFSWCWSTK